MTGMVLQAGNIGEYDKRIVLLTKERGRISAFARGAKKATSQYAAACQPFTFGEFSLYEGKNSFNLMWAGVDNYFDTLKKAIFSVYSGETYIEPSLMPLLNSSLAERDVLKEKVSDLTRREMEVLKMIASGAFNKEIALTLNISERTVKNHVSNIFKKIGVSDRTQAAVFAIKNNIISIK